LKQKAKSSVSSDTISSFVGDNRRKLTWKNQ